jgi:2-dehydro-3-deoxyphosphogluconate aldolase/(4S)-4-hydroxy-2-oxoglutarate aldolase
MLSETVFLKLKGVFAESRIIPIAVFTDSTAALKATELLLKHNLTVVEITLRTDSALTCIDAVRKHFPELCLGCGTVLSREEFDAVSEIGVDFAVSPCWSTDLYEYASAFSIPYIPGIATPTELNRVLEEGISLVKFFPAAPIGGVPYLSSLIAPFRKRNFHIIPTGGINENNIVQFMSIPEVICCGMSSIIERSLLEKGDFEELERRIETFISLVAP